MTVRDIMTPRSVAFMLDGESKIEDYVKSNDVRTFSRIPVYQDEKDNVVGLVLKDELLDMTADGQGGKKIKDIMLEINIVRDDYPLPDLFRFLAKSKKHLAAVKDEFGTVVGLVTLEDVFETLLGHEIVDESDKVVDLQEYARKKFGEE